MKLILNSYLCVLIIGCVPSVTSAQSYAPQDVLRQAAQQAPQMQLRTQELIQRMDTQTQQLYQQQQFEQAQASQNLYQDSLLELERQRNEILDSQNRNTE